MNVLFRITQSNKGDSALPYSVRITVLIFIHMILIVLIILLIIFTQHTHNTDDDESDPGPVLSLQCSDDYLLSRSENGELRLWLIFTKRLSGRDGVPGVTPSSLYIDEVK